MVIRQFGLEEVFEGSGRGVFGLVFCLSARTGDGGSYRNCRAFFGERLHGQMVERDRRGAIARLELADKLGQSLVDADPEILVRPSL